MHTMKLCESTGSIPTETGRATSLLALAVGASFFL